MAGGNNASPKKSKHVTVKKSKHVEASVNMEEVLLNQGFEVGKTIGVGAYSKVKDGWSNRHNKQIAIKIINLKDASGMYRDKYLPRELDIIKRLKHERLVEVLSIIECDQHVYIVMEKAVHGDLLGRIELFGTQTEKEAKRYFNELVEVLEYFQKEGIVHRDIKCENVLLDQNNHVKLSDFTFARNFQSGDKCKTFCGTLAYIAPEILREDPYDARASDIWSLGVVLYLMLVGKDPFNTDSIPKLLKEQTERGVEFPESCNITSEVKELIMSMLTPDVEKRATLIDILNSKWLQL